MSRTTLCVCAAAVLVAVSLSVVLARRQALGDELRQPGGPGTWKITMLVQGKTLADARLFTATPMAVGRQQLVREQAHSDELTQRTQEQHPDRRELAWSQAPGVAAGRFRIRYECWLTLRSESQPTQQHHQYAAPKEGEFLAAEPGIESTHPEIGALARQVADSSRSLQDQAEQIDQFIEQEIALEPATTTGSVTALDCLHRQSGGSAARSRLLAALCRNRGIPARLVTGLILVDGEEQAPHTWVEIWANSHWLPICPTYHHFGKVPRTFVIFAFGDHKLAHGRNARDVEPAFLVERVTSAAVDTGTTPSFWKQLFRAASLTQLPLAEQRLAELLLMFPVAALIICLFRNVVGLSTFGTFTPALIGLAFRDLRSWPGVLVFVAIVMAGWGLRRVLNRFHMLQVPRISLMLSLVISMLVCFVVVSYRLHWPTTRYISMFPLVILTSMIERFWTLEEEDGTRASFRTLLATLFISACISVVISRPVLTQHMLRYPETVGFIMAAIMLLGRYTGYRVLELYRFRDFTRQAPVRERAPASLMLWTGKTSFGSNRF